MTANITKKNSHTCYKNTNNDANNYNIVDSDNDGCNHINYEYSNTKDINEKSEGDYGHMESGMFIANDDGSMTKPPCSLIKKKRAVL